MERTLTVSGKVPPLVFTIVHYKLRITTVSVYLCVQILSACPLWSISGCSSGIVIVSPSQKIKLYPDNPTHHCPYTTINTVYYVYYGSTMGVDTSSDMVT